MRKIKSFLRILKNSFRYAEHIKKFLNIGLKTIEKVIFARLMSKVQDYSLMQGITIIKPFW